MEVSDESVRVQQLRGRPHAWCARQVALRPPRHQLHAAKPGPPRPEHRGPQARRATVARHVLPPAHHHPRAPEHTAPTPAPAVSVAMSVAVASR